MIKSCAREASWMNQHNGDMTRRSWSKSADMRYIIRTWHNKYQITWNREISWLKSIAGGPHATCTLRGLKNQSKWTYYTSNTHDEENYEILGGKNGSAQSITGGPHALNILWRESWKESQSKNEHIVHRNPHAGEILRYMTLEVQMSELCSIHDLWRESWDGGS